MDPVAQEEELRRALARVARGDAPALKAVYDRTSAKLFGICLRILGERSEAEDVLQEVYLSVWRSSARFDAARGSPIAWLAAIAHHRSIDRLRTRGARKSEPVDAALGVVDGALSALAGLEAAERAKRLNHCVGELDTLQQDAIRSAFLDGFTYDQLALRAGVPLGTMKSWIRRSLAKLKSCMDR